MEMEDSSLAISVRLLGIHRRLRSFIRAGGFLDISRRHICYDVILDAHCSSATDISMPAVPPEVHLGAGSYHDFSPEPLRPLWTTKILGTRRYRGKQQGRKSVTLSSMTRVYWDSFFFLRRPRCKPRLWARRRCTRTETFVQQQKRLQWSAPYEPGDHLAADNTKSF